MTLLKVKMDTINYARAVGMSTDCLRQTGAHSIMMHVKEMKSDELQKSAAAGKQAGPVFHKQNQGRPCS